MKNDFLNPTKSNVNLKNYTNINLFYNYRIRYSIPFTESQEEIMFLIQSSWLAIEKLEIAIQYHNISKRSIKSWNIQMSYIFLNSVSFSSWCLKLAWDLLMISLVYLLPYAFNRRWNYFEEIVFTSCVICSSDVISNW